jgi:type II secretory pathway pseudopilin PulG
MRLPRVRFTVRRMMAVVLIVAVLLAATLSVMRLVRLRRRASEFWDVARYHRQHGRAYIIRAKDKHTGQTVTSGELEELNREWTAYHDANRRKFEYHSAHPVAFVSPNAPHPVFDLKPNLSIDIHYQD